MRTLSDINHEVRVLWAYAETLENRLERHGERVADLEAVVDVLRARANGYDDGSVIE